MVYIEKVKIKIGIFSGGQKQATQHYDEKDDMIDYDDNKEDYDNIMINMMMMTTTMMMMIKTGWALGSQGGATLSSRQY